MTLSLAFRKTKSGPPQFSFWLDSQTNLKVGPATFGALGGWLGDFLPVSFTATIAHGMQIDLSGMLMAEKCVEVDLRGDG